MRFVVLGCSLLIAGQAVSTAQACSLPSPYRVPSNLQLVDRADAIVLARVVDGGSTEYGGRIARLVPIAAIKGDLAGRQIIFDAGILETTKDGRATPSDPRNLVDTNPDAFSGSCSRDLFKKDMIVVAFLKRNGANFVPLPSAFSRTLEDVPAPDSLWVKAVRMYVEIASKPKRARRAAMKSERDRLQSEIEDADARLLSQELDRALRS